jgi:hypothetical protein
MFLLETSLNVIRNLSTGTVSRNAGTPLGEPGMRWQWAIKGRAKVFPYQGETTEN